MAYITDQEFARQQSESLARLIEAEKRAKALLEAQKIEPKPNKHNKKELVKDGK